jgi:hypothetical protein
MAASDTDYQLAMKHKYVTLHGRKPAPGVTSCDITEKGGIKWGAAEMAVKATLEFISLTDYDQAQILDAHRDTLAIRKEPESRMINVADGEKGDKVDVRKANYGDLRQHYLRGRFQVAWDETAVRGNRVHDMADKLSTSGVEVDCLAEDAGYLDAWYRFYDENGPVFLFTERICVNPSPRGRDDWEYGGRFDAIILFTKGRFKGQIRLIDYKTGGHYDIPFASQAAGYLSCPGMANYLPNGDLHALVTPFPEEMNGAVSVHLHGDGTYELLDPFRYILFADAQELFFASREILNHIHTVEKAERRAKALIRAEKKAGRA